MTCRSFFKKVFLINAFLLSCIALPAQVMWNLKGGFMPVKEQHVYEDSETKLNWMAGLEIEIPLSQKLSLETGLRYKNATTCFYDSSDEYHEVSHLELPVRLTYKHRLGDNLSLHAGIGPYIGITPEVGIEPSIAINWKSISLGLTYTNPCFYFDKGNFRDYKNNNSGLMLTVGIRFHSRAWKYIGPGLLAAGAVAGTVVAATQGSNSSNSYSPNSSSNTSNYNNESSYQANSRKNASSETCQSCKGTGLCRSCKGSGQDKQNIILTNKKMRCRVCHGHKYCPDCKGKNIIRNTRKNNNTGAECRDCNGSTKCGECDGKGWYYERGNVVQCWRCKGERTCQTCNGTGRR